MSVKAEDEGDLPKPRGNKATQLLMVLKGQCENNQDNFPIPGRLASAALVGSKKSS